MRKCVIRGVTGVPSGDIESYENVTTSPILSFVGSCTPERATVKVPLALM